LFGQLKDAYIEDGIHLNTDGRSEWTRTIKPYVDKEAARKDACK
jgi:lysophospholipase L1-like esterase